MDISTPLYTSIIWANTQVRPYIGKYEGHSVLCPYGVSGQSTVNCSPLLAPNRSLDGSSVQ